MASSPFGGQLMRSTRRGAAPAQWPAHSLPHPEHPQRTALVAAGTLAGMPRSVESLEQKSRVWLIGGSW